MIRDSVDVYINGQVVARNGTIAAQGSEIRITGSAVFRFNEAQLVKTTAGTLAYRARDPETGKTVEIAALSRQDCGCGKK